MTTYIISGLQGPLCLMGRGMLGAAVQVLVARAGQGRAVVRLSSVGL